MDLRKTLRLCAAFLLVAGFSGFTGVAHAQQVGNLQGVWVRVTAPTNGNYAKIGDTIRVNVMSLKGVVDSLFVAVATDTSAASGDSLANVRTVAALTNGYTGSTSHGSVIFAAKQDTLNAYRTSAQIDTFKFKFGIAPGDTEFVSKSALKVNIFPRSHVNGTFYKLSNLETANQVTASGTFASTYVGAGDQFSMDGKRPVSTAAFDSVRIDTSGLTASTLVTGGRSIKTGSKVIVKLAMNIGQVIASNAASAKVVLVDTTGQSTLVNSSAILDSALYTKTFDNILQSSVADTFTVTAGTFKNDQRIMAVAFLQDAAGNLSASSASSSTPQGFTSSLVYLADATAPTITAVNPNPDSSKLRFTGKIDTSFAYRDSNGASSTKTFTFNPLKFKVSEGITKATVKFGSDSTVTLGSSDLTSLNGLGTTSLATDIGNTAKAGKSLDLTISVTDTVGNTTSKTLSGVTYDEVLPAISNLFPTSAKAPKNTANSDKPTINNITRNPTMRLSEALDSLAVRYVQVGTSPAQHAIQRLSSSNPDLAKVDQDISVTMGDTLIDGQQYTLQVYAQDLAGNISVTAPDTLTFTKNFNNPSADSFLVAVQTPSGTALPDSVIAGQALQLKITAIDSQLSRTSGSTQPAVTYNGPTRVHITVADSEMSKLAGITFSGTGVSVAASDTGKGLAMLSSDGWVTGSRDIVIKSKWVLHNFTVWVANYSTAADGSITVNFNGQQDSLYVDAAEMSKYMVTAMMDGAPVDGVSGQFQVKVMPTDEYGNPSTKTRSLSGGSSYAISDSTDLLDTRIAKTNVLKQLFVELSTNIGDAGVPSGAQAIGPWGATFTATAPNRTGSGLVISARTVNSNPDTTGFGVSTTKYLNAMGNTGSLSFAPAGVVPVAGAPAAPDTLIVQDYKGANGQGDQGGFVLATFPQSMDSTAVTAYRIYREIWVSVVDSNGTLKTLDTPVQKWVPWTKVDPVADSQGLIRAVVPTLDNVPTRWAVASEKGLSSSSPTVASKRVFTKESVQLMARFLGVDPNRVLSTDELSKLITPPQDYVKSILGDQQNVQFAALDPDLSSLTGTGTVPQNIRTDASGSVVSSPLTMSALAVAAHDDIPPVAVTDATGGKADNGVNLTWKASTSDKVVAFSTYDGFSIPILGVAKYEVWRGTSADNMQLLATLDPGTTSYQDTNLPQGVSSLMYRVDALDLDNQTMGTPFSVIVSGRVKFYTAAHVEVFIVNLSGTTPLTEDFEDFIAFAKSYGKSTGQTGFNIQADTNDDGTVDFTDFINFAKAYNLTAVSPATKPVMTPVKPGVNENTQLSLDLGSDRVVAGQTVSLNVSLTNAKALYGYGFTLNYDPTKFELVDAKPAQNDLLKSTGGQTPLFLEYNQTPGQVTIANAVINGNAVSGNGQIATLTFKVLNEFEDNTQFSIANGIVFDPNQLPNPVVTLGNLNVQSTPTEFALHQNFPNPFNPETTIKYDLAEGANVQLRIYNIVGQVVRTLVAEHQAAGRYQVRWNGTDDRGMAVSSGIYFYQISAGKFQDVKRLMLLK